MPARTLAYLALAACLAACGTEPGAQAASTGYEARAPAEEPATAPPDPARHPQPNARLLTPDGWGPLRIGMTRAEVVAAAGEDAHPEAVGGPDPEQCDEFRPRNTPEGVLVMIEDGVLTRISVSRNPTIFTPAGLRVGDSEADVLGAYGSQASVQPHKYQAPPAKYITVWGPPAADGERRGILYEVGTDGAVAFLRGGGPSIEYVEGCL